MPMRADQRRPDVPVEAAATPVRDPARFERHEASDER